MLATKVKQMILPVAAFNCKGPSTARPGGYSLKLAGYGKKKGVAFRT